MMSHNAESAISLSKPTLSLSGIRAYCFELLLISAAVILPVAAHMAGAPVRFLLPMHWPVILAGLVYGWRAGALTGLLAPIVSYALSGYPLPIILPSMTVELLTYGLATGLLREIVRLNPFIAVTIALVIGRLVFTTSVLISSLTTHSLAYFQASLSPGLVAALGQIAVLPFLAKWWIGQERRSTDIQ
jgi:niacin transporter